MKDILFLLKPGFRDPQHADRVFYCPGCAAVRGLLAWFPALLDAVEVRDVDYPRPRPEVAEWLGPEHPGCPVLVLHPSRPATDPFVQRAGSGARYVLGSRDIGLYFARRCGIPAPHD